MDINGIVNSLLRIMDAAIVNVDVRPRPMYKHLSGRNHKSCLHQQTYKIGVYEISFFFDSRQRKTSIIRVTQEKAGLHSIEIMKKRAFCI